MANVANKCTINTGFKHEYQGQLYVRYSTKKGVNYLRFAVNDCLRRATLNNEVIAVTEEHLHHIEMKEDTDRLKIVSECTKRAAEQDSQSMRKIFDEVSQC
jgi:DNA mismatch repair ATPase MutS